MSITTPRAAVVLGLAVGLASCRSTPGEPVPTLTADELMDPTQCQKCHPDAFSEWSGSMHAYASDDPVFVAMNARGQRETKGALGSFCVKCHAPLAVATNSIAAPYDVTTLPQHLKGVTCFFCHSVQSVNGAHDNPLTLATDGVLRASIQDPLANTGHHAAYEKLLDRNDPSSASMCGSCHDIVNSFGTQLERTYEEWQATVFAHAPPPVGLTCGECHMNGSQGLAAEYTGVGLRTVHSHEFPGVDLPLTTFPNADTLKTDSQAFLDSTLQAALCVKGMPGQAVIQVVLDNVGAGHLWPSGATQDRRAWVEVMAYTNAQPTQPFYQSGVVADGEEVLALNDPDLWLIRDCILDGQNNEVHMFWQAASYDSNQLPGPLTNMPTDPRYYLTHVMREYPAPTSTPSMLTTMPDRVTMRVRLVPVGLDVIDDLTQSGDLDAGVKAAIFTYALAGTTLEWTAASATVKYVDNGLPVLCRTSGIASGSQGANPAPAHTKCQP
jgi:hypothetical protein